MALFIKKTKLNLTQGINTMIFLVSLKFEPSMEIVLSIEISLGLAAQILQCRERWI